MFSNIRSLLPKLDEVKLICLSSSCHIFCLAETWLSNDIPDSELSVPGYTLFRHDRNRHGGGVAIYISSLLTASLFIPTSPDIELLMIKIPLPSVEYVSPSGIFQMVILMLLLL